MSDDTLIAKARKAQAAAYAPYSGFHVGAAVLAGGKVYTGSNIENASFGLAICAERNAVAAAVLAGHRHIDAIAVATETDPPTTPCGMCRQVLLEFTESPSKLRVIAVGPNGSRAEWTLAKLLPHGFTGKGLVKRE
jgi:cytidine deaminase